MSPKRYWLLIILSMTSCLVFGQKDKVSYYFDEPIIADSSSTVIIPTRYHSDFLSVNKIALSGDFYANIIFYNFTADTYKRLFDRDTYIVAFDYDNYYSDRYKPKKPKNITSKWIFYRVRNMDRNKNGRMDSTDPAILYVSDLSGNNLKALTSDNENVLSIDIFEKQNFALIKIQRDQDNDQYFRSDDKDFYFVKLDLTTMNFGSKIDIQ